MTSKIDTSIFVGKFKEEAIEHIEVLNDGFLKLENGSADKETVDGIFRAAHTLKGSAKMVGLENIGHVAHKMEDLLGAIKDKRVSVSRDICDLLFVSLDTIQLLLEAPQDGEKLVDISAIVSQLEKASAKDKIAKEEPEAVIVAQEPVEPEAPVNEAPAVKSPGSQVEGFDDIIRATGQRRDDHEETIRVSTGKLDYLINMVGELAINQIRAVELNKETMSLSKILKNTNRQWLLLKDNLALIDDEWLSETTNKVVEECDKSLRDLSETLTSAIRNRLDNVSRFDNIVNQLEREIFGVRMLPIAIIFRNIPRAVRDLARTLNKEITVEIIGEDTELDKKMIEALSDPLMHMIRNAVDHGIEMPDDREAGGKPREGKIVVEARQEGEHVEISVTDDGRGIDLDSVKRKAIGLGLVSEADILMMSDENIFSFLFNPGFTTKEEATEVSGRGVGMDVVKANVEKLEGSTRLISSPSQGTTIIIRVPLTMAITRCLLVRVGSEVFGIPTTTIEETTRIDPGTLQTVEGRLATTYRGEVLPMVFLADLLKLERGEISEEKYPIVIIGTAGGRIGFVVEDHLGEQEMVIKGFDDLLTNISNVSGAAILGSGDVIVILHVSDLLDSARSVVRQVPMNEAVQARDDIGEGRHRAESKEMARILVVDDSMATRELERSILRSYGFIVDVAIDGVDALEQLSIVDYDLVIADVQMPRMDGLGLTQKIKQSDHLKTIPVIIVTSLSEDEDKKRGLDSGAEAYIVKSAFSQENLIETVRMVLGIRG